jgi:hypothetical protein
MEGNFRLIGKWNRDRRSGLRFPIDSSLEYKILRNGKVLESGPGRTLNISSSGVLFESDAGLTPGATVELSIAWPARLYDTAPIQLHVRGKAVRISGGAVAVRIVSYDFRTKARAANAVANLGFSRE